MVSTVIDYICDRHGIGIEIFDVSSFATISNPAKILDEFAQAIKKPNVRYAVFDHISSLPAIIFPVKEMVDLCKEHNVISIVDGAHAIGHIAIDINLIDPDFYITNLHKWMFCPKGTAVLYVSKRHHDKIYPAVLSHTSEEGFANLLQRRFSWMGTNNYCRFAVIQTAMQYMNSLGGLPELHYKCLTVKQRVADMLQKNWSTQALNSENCRMLNIQLPFPNSMGALRVNEEIWKRTGCFVPVFEFDGGLWIRLSFQVFNTAEDYSCLIQAVRGIQTTARL